MRKLGLEARPVDGSRGRSQAPALQMQLEDLGNSTTSALVQSSIDVGSLAFYWALEDWPDQLVCNRTISRDSLLRV